MNNLEVGKIYTNGKLTREIIKIDNYEIYYKTESGKEKQCWITTFQDWVKRGEKFKNKEEKVLDGKIIYTKDDDWEFEYSDGTRDKDEGIGLILDGIDMLLLEKLKSGDRIAIKVERSNDK